MKKAENPGTHYGKIQENSERPGNLSGLFRAVTSFCLFELFPGVFMSGAV